MVRLVLSVFLLVCMSVTLLNSAHNAFAQEPVESLSDLVGAKGGQAEGELESRGYTWVKTDKSAGVYSYWTEDSTGKCVTIHVEDGRYQSIVYAPKSDCQNGDSAKAEPTTATVEGQCKLYNKKSDNNKYKGSCTIKQKMTDNSNKFVITLGNGETYKFIEQSNGYEVHTPEGVSNNTATMTDHGDKAVFKWGKWELTAKEN